MKTKSLFLLLVSFATLTLSGCNGVLGKLYSDIGSSAVKNEPLVNSYQLEKVLNYIGKKSIDRNNARNIPYYGNVKRGKLDGGKGYTDGVSANIRMVGRTIGRETKILGMPSLFYFPDDPKKDPLRIVTHTSNIIEDQAADILSGKGDKTLLAKSKVVLTIKELNGEKDWTIVYGQVVLDHVKTTVKVKRTKDKPTKFEIVSLVDISDMDTDAAIDFFETYQNKLSILNAAIAKSGQNLY